MTLKTFLPIAASFVLAKNIFESVWQPNLVFPVTTLLAAVAVSLVVTAAAANRSLAVKPAKLF